MRVLVLGAGGLVGSNVVAAAADRSDHDVLGTYHSTEPALEADLAAFDLTDAAAFAERFDLAATDAVVNCAAMTDVDACESAPSRADRVNGEAPGDIARACAENDVAFVHLSTDYVFDGEVERPYAESDEPNPIQAYGRSKLSGENNVRANHPRAAILRLSFVWGVHRATGDLTGFPAWVASRVADDEPVPLFTDQRVSPSRAGAVAETCLEVLEAGVAGTYHVASRSCTTPYEFGVAIADEMGVAEPPLDRSSTDDVDRAAPRPSNTCLDVGAIEAELDRRQPTLRADLDAVPVDWSAYS